MTKTKRDIIIASALVLIFIVVFTKNVLMRAKFFTPQPEGQEEMAADASVKNLVFVTNLRSNDIILKEQEKFWDGDFKRNPFMTQAEVSETGDIKDLILKGVFWDETNPKALVNDKFLGKDDEIMGYKVREIRFKSVVFWTGEKEVEVFLFQGPPPGETSKEASK